MYIVNDVGMVALPHVTSGATLQVALRYRWRYASLAPMLRIFEIWFLP